MDGTLPVRGVNTPGPLVIAAFEGWNDAGEAASTAVDHLLTVWEAEEVCALEAEPYLDFQVNRPVMTIGDDGERHIEWPTTRIYLAEPPGASRDVILVRGVEPSLRWRTFSAELLDRLQDLGVDLMVTLGAMLSDVPHTRPLPVASTTSDETLMARLALEPSHYEGPTGIVGVLLDGARRRRISHLSLWAAVPNYVGQSPSPKAALALLNRVEELLEAPLPLGDLPLDAAAWETAVTDLADEDPDMAGYISYLEEEKETTELPEASGDAIARDFERFLRRRTTGTIPQAPTDGSKPATSSGTHDTDTGPHPRITGPTSPED